MTVTPEQTTVNKLLCEFCGKPSRNTYTLARHHKSKACLMAQGRDTSEGQVECDTCAKSYARTSIKAHRITCAHKVDSAENESLQTENTALRKKIELLQNEIKVLKENPSVVQNIQNNIHVSDSFISANFDRLTHDEMADAARAGLKRAHVLGGAKAVGQLMSDTVFKNKVVTSDRSRSTVKFVDEKGDVVRDPGVEELSTQTFQACLPTLRKIRNRSKFDLEEERRVAVNMKQMEATAQGDYGNAQHKAFRKVILSRTQPHRLEISALESDADTPPPGKKEKKYHSAILDEDGRWTGENTDTAWTDCSSS